MHPVKLYNFQGIVASEPTEAIDIPDIIVEQVLIYLVPFHDRIA